MTLKTHTLLAGLLATVLLLTGRDLAAQDGTVLGRTVGFLTGGPAVDLSPTSCPEGGACQNGCCGGCNQCSRQWDTFGSVEFLLWWAKGTGVPPLVSTGPLNTGTVLFGDQLLASKARAGGRITAGIWLDPEHNVAAGGRFFGLGGDTTRFFASSDGTTPLARPFFDALLNVPSSFIVASPGISAGNVSAFGNTNNILGAEAFTEIMMQRDERRRVDLVAGYQFLRLNDWVQIDSTTTTPILPAPLVTINMTDRFSTANQFHGGEFGLRGRVARGQWSADVLGLVGLGNMNEQVTIAGSTTVNGVTNPGGILAQNTNIGTYSRNRFTFIPQLTANLKYHFTPNASVHIGYNIIWISNIVTAGDQIDTVVNSSQIGGGPLVGPARPAFAFHDNDYWLQGINFGANWDF
jgi:hypothetical protein